MLYFIDELFLSKVENRKGMEGKCQYSSKTEKILKYF